MCRSLRTLALGVIAATAIISAPAHATEFKVHGLLELVAAERGTAYEHNLLTRKDSQFDAYGVRLFADALVNDRVQIFSQFILREAANPYVDGAYVMLTPRPGQDVHLLAGKIPWPIGTYAPRTYSNKNPLVGAPLMYQYHSTLVWYDIPPDAAALIGTKGSGQYGVDYHGYQMGYGMPIVDDCYWDVGATVVGSARMLEFSGGVVAGTPGWGSVAHDENSGKSVLGRIGFMPFPSLRFGVSGSYGPYLNDNLNPQLPAGKSATDYHQKLGMADLEVLAGHAELRAEGALNQWESPTVGDLDVTSVYAELKYAFTFGGFVAGRYDVLRFGDITDAGGALHSWDSNVDRIETGLGYRFDRGTVAKVIYQQTLIERELINDRRLQMVAAQVSVGF